MPIVGPLSQSKATRTLVRKLSPTVDRLRQIATNLGVRPYRVFLVRTRWSGEERGEGQEVVYDEREILPTPRVKQVSNLMRYLTEVGVGEQGELKVIDIATTYTEYQLTGKNDDGSDPADTEQFYWEIRGDAGMGSNPPRRRFIPTGAPYYNAGCVRWEVTLRRAQEDRSPTTGYPR